MSLKPLHPDAIGFTLFRALPDGRARDYTAVSFRGGWAGADQFRRKCQAVGWLRDDMPDPYGVLDVIDSDGDIVQDYAVPDARTFQRIKRDLGLAVESTDGDNR